MNLEVSLTANKKSLPVRDAVFNLLRELSIRYSATPDQPSWPS